MSPPYDIRLRDKLAMGRPNILACSPYAIDDEIYRLFATGDATQIMILLSAQVAAHVVSTAQ